MAKNCSSHTSPTLHLPTLIMHTCARAPECVCISSMWLRYIAIQSMVYCAGDIETVTIITQLDILSATEAYNTAADVLMSHLERGITP